MFCESHTSGIGLFQGVELFDTAAQASLSIHKQVSLPELQSVCVLEGFCSKLVVNKINKVLLDLEQQLSHCMGASSGGARPNQEGEQTGKRQRTEWDRSGLQYEIGLRSWAISSGMVPVGL